MPGLIGIGEEAAALEGALQDLLDQLGAVDVAATVSGANAFKLDSGDVIRGDAFVTPVDEIGLHSSAHSWHANKVLVSETGVFTDELVQDTDGYRAIYLELSYRYVESVGAPK